MNNNFLGIRGLYKTHMDGLKPFNSKSVTYTYIRYTEHNSRGQPIVRRDEGGGLPASPLAGRPAGNSVSLPSVCLSD